VPALSGELAKWVRSPIDAFVGDRLQQEKLSPSPEAPRERWLRRATFDLTGLPPKPEEIDAFLADSSPDAFEKAADRLLGSVRFGERMAVPWLDAARYADSYGYQSDEEMRAWPYRDWVIRAFNENLPWDQFITWQLAGDMLPNATRDQRLATAFNRIHRKTQEGGSVEEEFRQDGISDRVHTVGTAFLGLTFECARCHDHKYDPISQRDYFALGAFFNSIDERGLLHAANPKEKQMQPHPVLFLTTAEQESVLKAQSSAVETAERVAAELPRERESAFREWLAGLPESRTPHQVASFSLDEAKDGKLANSVAGDKPGTLGGGNTLVPGKSGQAVLFNGDDQLEVPSADFTHCSDPMTAAFWLKPGEDYPRAVVLHKTTGFDVNYSGIELLLEDGKLRWTWAREWPGSAISVLTKAKVPTGEWTHVAVSYDGSRRAAGLRIYLNGRSADVEVLRDKLAKDISAGTALEFGRRSRDNGLRGGAVDEIQMFTRALTPIEVAQIFDGKALAELLKRPERSEAELAELRAYYFSAVDPEVSRAMAAVRAARISWREMMDEVQEIPTMEELPEPVPAFVLNRGAYDAPGEPVGRVTPAALPPFPRMPAQSPRARAVAHLTAASAHRARAHESAVAGILRARARFDAGKFRRAGAAPSHPELLDWLARDFIAHGWDYKRACRQIVLSATYRQDSRAAIELRQLDPENVLLARGPARRLSAEELRDSALALGGLLRGTIGGPPVKALPAGGLDVEISKQLPP
jgi:hypothetical protein